jgi:hypothetical protein
MRSRRFSQRLTSAYNDDVGMPTYAGLRAAHVTLHDREEFETDVLRGGMLSMHG